VRGRELILINRSVDETCLASGIPGSHERSTTQLNTPWFLNAKDGTRTGPSFAPLAGGGAA